MREQGQFPQNVDSVENVPQLCCKHRSQRVSGMHSSLQFLKKKDNFFSTEYSHVDMQENLQSSLLREFVKKLETPWGSKYICQIKLEVFLSPFPQQSLEIESLALAPLVVQIAKFCSLAIVGSSIRTSKIFSLGSADPLLRSWTVRTPKTSC